MRLVTGAEKQVQALGLSIGEVQLTGSLRQVDERHVFLFCHDAHRLYVTHTQVGSRNTLVLVQYTVLDLGELIAQVMTTVPLDVAAAEIGAADRCNQDRVYAQRTCLVDERTQVIAIGRLRIGASCIRRCRQTVGCAVLSILQVIHSVGNGSFIIVGKLDQQVIAGTHLTLH